MNDLSLTRYLRAGSDFEAADTLDRLMSGEVDRSVRAVVKHRLAAAAVVHSRQVKSQIEEDIDDVIGSAKMAIAKRLSQLRSDEAGEPVANLNAYCQTTAARACDAYFRDRFKVRYSLMNRVRYALESKEGLAVWTDASGLLAGYDLWQEKAVPVNERRIREASESIALAATAAFASVNASGKLVPYIVAALNWAGGPVPLDLLVSLVAEGTGEKDLVRAEDPADADGSLIDRTAAATDIHKISELREGLKEIWSEIAQLQVRHAQALLLNFTDDRGKGIIDLFPLTGVAMLPEIAAVMGLGAQELAQIWNELPWADVRIAEFMSVTTTEVSNYRSIARRRLKRKVPAYAG